MALSDELLKLQQLHQQGALTADEFARAKATLIDAAAAGKTASSTAPALAAVNAFRRSRRDRWLAGVCGGVAQATGLEPWAVRLLFTVLLLWGGAGLMVYVLLWIFVPSD